MKKIGLALSGGGARGAYQIGVWKAFKEHGIDKLINAYAGASVGSLNAILFAMDDYDLAYKTWNNLDERQLFVYSKKDIFKRLRDEKLNFLNKGVYNTKKLKELMEEVIIFEKLENKEVYVSTTLIGDHDGKFFDLIKTNYKHFFKDENRIKYSNISGMTESEIKNTVLASCAIPVAFKPITIGAQTFYDGGILDNIPSIPLIENDCDVIIVIDLFKFSPSRHKLKKNADNIIEIYPHRSLRGILDFRQKHFERRFEHGYIDGINAIPKIKELIKEN